MSQRTSSPDRRPSTYGQEHPSHRQKRISDLQASLVDGSCFLDCPPSIAVECDDDAPDYAKPFCPRRATITQEINASRRKP